LPLIWLIKKPDACSRLFYCLFLLKKVKFLILHFDNESALIGEGGNKMRANGATGESLSRSARICPKIQMRGRLLSSFMIMPDALPPSLRRFNRVIFRAGNGIGEQDVPLLKKAVTEFLRRPWKAFRDSMAQTVEVSFIPERKVGQIEILARVRTLPFLAGNHPIESCQILLASMVRPDEIGRTD